MVFGVYIPAHSCWPPRGVYIPLKHLLPLPLLPRSLATAWVNAFDQVGFPFCVTQILYKNEKPANITFVHPGGVTAGTTGATRT